MALRALLAAALAWITSALITPAQRLARPRRRQPTTIRMDSTELDVGGVRLSIYDGRVALQWDGAARSFAATKIAAGAFLGTYAGDALTGDDYEARYGGAAVPEYVVRVDGDLYLDGRAAADAETFTPALLNHGGGDAANVVRYCASRRPPVIDFFAARDVDAGEELLFDYGDQYWAGRADAPDDAGPEAEAFDLDAPFLDPDDERDQGVVLEKVKGWYRADPQAFEAAYVGAVIAVGVFFAQFVVRWYKSTTSGSRRRRRTSTRPWTCSRAGCKFG
ncbi:hypothetical protein JL721_4216 [Aureococcus anophagefferens]|nr:hypothetical protein JL721_4216 [Aureococcus anophagefferens]